MPLSNPSDALEAEKPKQPSMAIKHGDPMDSPDFDHNDAGGYQNDEKPVLIENWKPTVDAIIATTFHAFRLSPKGSAGSEPDRAKFLEYWREVFAKLMAEIAADSTSPEHLTSPPTKRFIVKFYNEPSGLCCPCALPSAWPSITLENEHGVTKLDLVKGVGDFLYGKTAPKIYYEVEEEDGYLPEAGSLTMETALTYYTDWLSGSIEGDTWISYYRDVPQLFLYCCVPSKFREKFDEHVREKEEQNPEPKTRSTKL
ncbi:hypothetical protein VTI74DRAFT_9141 [Chaetomium olivicolor]